MMWPECGSAAKSTYSSYRGPGDQRRISGSHCIACSYLYLQLQGTWYLLLVSVGNCTHVHTPTQKCTCIHMIKNEISLEKYSVSLLL